MVFKLNEPVRLSHNDWLSYEQYLDNLYTKLKTSKVVKSGETRIDNYACSEGRRKAAAGSTSKGARNCSHFKVLKPCSAGMSVVFHLDGKEAVTEVVIRRPTKGGRASAHSYSIGLSLYRKPVTAGIRQELANEIAAGITAAAAAKKVKAKHGGVSIKRYHARYSGRHSIRASGTRVSPSKKNNPLMQLKDAEEHLRQRGDHHYAVYIAATKKGDKKGLVFASFEAIDLLKSLGRFVAMDATYDTNAEGFYLFNLFVRDQYSS